MKKASDIALSRRELLERLSAGILALGLPASAHANDILEPGWALRPQLGTPAEAIQVSGAAKLGMVLGAGTLVPRGEPEYHINVIDLDAVAGESADYRLHRIEIDFFGHGIVPDPINPQRASVFQKKGRGACEIDLQARAVIRQIVTTDDRRFYGHGAYSPDGALLYCTETRMDGQYTGLIAVRDAKTHQELGEFPTFGASPHDCWLIDDGKTMVTTNGGGTADGAAPSVTYVDVAAEKLIEKLEFDREDINAGHLAITAAGDIAVISAQREGLSPYSNTGGISLRPSGGEFRQVGEPADVVANMFGETLSLAIDADNNTIAATTPVGNLLTFWDLKTGELKRHYPAHNPRGVALTQDGRYFVLSYEKPPHVSLIDTVTLDKVADFDLRDTGMSGSHIISYSLPEPLRRPAAEAPTI